MARERYTCVLFCDRRVGWRVLDHAGHEVQALGLKTILTPIVLLISGASGLIAAWAGGAEFWLFLAIVLLSGACLVKHAVRVRRDKADRLATIAAEQQGVQAARKRRQK